MIIKILGYTITITKAEEKKEIFIPVINKAQTAEDVKEITKKYNLDEMKQRIKTLRAMRADSSAQALINQLAR